MNNRCMALFAFFSLVAVAFSQNPEIEIGKMLQEKNAKTGVSVMALDRNCLFSVNGDSHFPMQSVFKFHIALAVMHEVDLGNLSLDTRIYIRKKDLLENTWSPLREKYPKGNVYIKLSELLGYTVSSSDNNGCDILLRHLGGPLFVEKYIRSVGIGDIAIQVNEEEMHQAWDVQFRNWTSPDAAVALLAKFAKGELLSDASTSFLMKLMTETSTGTDRLKGKLPAKTPVAHKTGSSGISPEGIVAAVNDIGIVTLPGGTRYCIAVFVTSSKESGAVNAGIIAGVSSAVWDHFTGSIPDEK